MGTSVARPSGVTVRPSILCPVDYSEASAGALRHAAAIAEHFVTRLIVLTVKTPFDTAGQDGGDDGEGARKASEAAHARYVATVFGDRIAARALCEYEVAIGVPAVEILRVARERSCDLIVMTSHGASGASTRPLGSTTERVLRSTTVPVLVPPAGPALGVDLETLGARVGRIVAPVDLSPASHHQVDVARALAQSLAIPLLLVHVLEPDAEGTEREEPSDADRRRQAEQALAALDARVGGRCRRELLVERGDPAEVIARVVRQRHAGLIVMGLHDSPRPEAHMGSVTYRTFCLAPAVVLGLPPRRAAAPAVEATRPDVRGGR